MSKFKTWLLDLWAAFAHIFDPRVLFLLIPSMTYMYVYQPEVTLTIIFTYAVLISIAAMSQWLRKIIFPYIDLSDHIDLVKKGDIASSIVILAVAMVICTFVLATVMWIRT